MTARSEVPPALRQLARLLKTWGPLPDLPGAACKGSAPLHDDVLPDENPAQQAARWNLALDACRGCPALTPCGELLDADGPPAWGGLGVQAGRVLAAPLRQRAGGVVAVRFLARWAGLATVWLRGLESS